MPRCLPMLASFFDRFFIDFHLQLRSPEPSKSMFFLKKNKAFSKNRSSKLGSMFARFWCQHASIFAPKIYQNPSKIRSQDASIFRSIFASIFYRFLLDFTSQLGTMLATFSLKMVVRCGIRPSFFLGLFSFSVFWPSRRPSREKCRARCSILEGFGLDFGRFWALFWKLLATIWAYDYSWKTYGSWKTYPSASAPLGKPALSIHSAGVWFWMGWWGYAKRKESNICLIMGFHKN